MKTAVDHVDLEIEAGSFVGIIVHTGSGKSTLIQHLNGLLRPTEGKVLLDGVDIWADKSKMRQMRFRVGLVFQYPEYQIFEETVAKDIAFGPRNMGLAEEEVQARVRETAAIVGAFREILKQSPFAVRRSETPCGNRRRYGNASGGADSDEPTAGLDPAGGRRFYRRSRRTAIRPERPFCWFLASMEDVARHEKILVMNAGKVFCYDTANVFPPFVGIAGDDRSGSAADHLRL